MSIFGTTINQVKSFIIKLIISYNSLRNVQHIIIATLLSSVGALFSPTVLVFNLIWGQEQFNMRGLGGSIIRDMWRTQPKLAQAPHLIPIITMSVNILFTNWPLYNLPKKSLGGSAPQSRPLSCMKRPTKKICSDLIQRPKDKILPGNYTSCICTVSCIQCSGRFPPTPWTPVWQRLIHILWEYYSLQKNHWNLFSNLNWSRGNRIEIEQKVSWIVNEYDVGQVCIQTIMICSD